ncbi:MAG TPA: MFS transporter [bacterium]|nr:MFS transporter [bacterium]
MEKKERRILTVTCLGHALTHVYILILAGSLGAITASFGKSITEITAVATAGYLLYGLGAFPSGVLAARAGAKRTLQIFYLGSALVAAGIGLSASFTVFSAGIILLGFFGSLYHVSGLALISQGIEKRGRAMGLHGIAGSAGIALTPLLAGALTSLWGWRPVYLVMAVPGLLGFLFLTLDRTIPAAHAVTPDIGPSGGVPPQARRMPPVFLVGAAMLVMALNGLIYRGFMTMLPTYISLRVPIGGVSALVAGGLVTTLILSFGMIGQFSGGHLSDRRSMIRLYLFCVSASLPFMLLIGLTSHLPLVLAALGFTLFHFAQQPVENHLLARLMPPRLVSWGYGIKFTLTFGVGSLAAGLSGWVTDRFGIEHVFLVLAGVIFVSAGLLAGIAWKGRGVNWESNI